MNTRQPYPSDVTDEEWAFVAPYLALVREDSPQRRHDLREVFNGLRWLVRTGAPWRMLPHDLPPWEAIYQQTRRWLDAGVFELIERKDVPVPVIVTEYVEIASAFFNEDEPKLVNAVLDSVARKVRGDRK